MTLSNASFTANWQFPSRRSRIKSRLTRIKEYVSDFFKRRRLNHRHDGPERSIPTFDGVSAKIGVTENTRDSERHAADDPSRQRNKTRSKIRHNSRGIRRTRGRNREGKLERQLSIIDHSETADATPHDISPISNPASEEAQGKFIMCQAEVKRTIREIEAKISKEKSQSSSGTNKPRPRLDSDPECFPAQDLLVNTSPYPFNEDDSVTPCEASPLVESQLGSKDSSILKDKFYEQTLEEMVYMPRINQRIRYSKRDKARALERGIDPVLAYKSQNNKTALHESKHYVNDVQGQTLARIESTSSHQGSCTISNIANHNENVSGEIEAEVQAYVKDVTQAAEKAVKATKKRSDLFVERVLLLERKSREIHRKKEIMDMLEKVDECGRHNKELSESLHRARELVCSVCKKT